MNADMILNRVAYIWNVGISALTNTQHREAHVIEARQAAAWLLYHNLRTSYSAVATTLGYGNSSRAFVAVQVAAERAKRNPEYEAMLRQVLLI